MAEQKLRELRGRDPEATRCAALDAAQRLFAEKGFAGTSMREIASASGISQPLIHYHFGSKEGLYHAVKERLVKKARESILPGYTEESKSAANPHALIRSAFAFFSDNEDLMRLIAWAHLERETAPWPGEEEIMRIMVDQIRRNLPDSPSGGKLDPLVATIMIEALILYWSQNSQYLSGFFDAPLPEVTKRYMDQVVRLFFVEAPVPGNHGE